MKRIVAVFFGAALCLSLYLLVNQNGVQGQGRSDKFLRAEQRVPGRYIVVLEGWAAGEPGASSRARQLAGELGLAYGGRIDRIFENAINGYSVELSEGQAIALSHDPRVKFVEEDGMMYASATQSNATWGLDRIDQRDLPLSGTYTYNSTGSGVRAYIVDTGIRASHTDFGGRVSGGFTSISDGRGTDDCNGHGTHVAGTVGGATWGVAKGVSLIPVRVLNCQGSGTTSGVIAGVDWVTANHVKPAVANMSLGGGASSSLDTAVNNSINAGVTYAVAAGNSNANACNYSPARVGAAITIGATTTSDARASYSNFGSCLDIFAPGSSITSAWYTSNTATNTISGTSMASPHVAGAAALYLAANPGASPSTVRNAIVNNATTGKVTGAGTGSPNLLLYSLFGSTEPTPNAPPTANFTFDCTGLTCSFSDASTDSDGTIGSRSWNFGDGGTSTATNPSHTYAAGGTYTVTLTVTDDDSDTGSTSKSVNVSSSGGGIALTVNGYKVQGVKRTDLAWSGASGTNVDIYRDGALVTTTANDGTHTDITGQRGGASHTYRVCNAGTSTCSANVTASY